jgi:uncharacterized protein (TIGR00299 family) protein
MPRGLVGLWGGVYNAALVGPGGGGGLGLSPFEGRGSSGLMHLAYVDCFAGISGAMTLAAFIHAGVQLERIQETLSGLPAPGFALEAEEVEAMGIAAIRLHVRSEAEGLIRTYSSIRQLLEDASVPERVRHASQRTFRLLAEAEARVHAKEVDLVTFHDPGDIDPIVGIVGTVTALDALRVDRLFSSPVPTGFGMARSEHGMTPIPSPVVVSLLQGAPTYSRGIPVELVTPVGAALLAALAEGYGAMPMMRAESIGYGAGHPRPDFPNVLRVVVGPEERAESPGTKPEDYLVQALIDAADVGELLDELMQTGARDAWSAPVIGPGGRAETLVQVVAGASACPSVIRMLQARTGRDAWTSRLSGSPPA